MTDKLPVTGELRVRVYNVLLQAVEDGVAYGWRRAHKHSENPPEDAIRESIGEAVMNAICERFDFPDEPQVEP